MYEKSVSAWSPAPWFLVSRPARPTDEVVRTRVIDHLDHVVDGARITRIVAPSGYGKTTALRQWADRTPTSVAWLTLTEFDDDPVRLHRGVISALKRAAEALDGDDTHPLLQLVPDVTNLAASYDGLAAALDRMDGPLAVVIDDAHHGGDALRRTLPQLLDRVGASTLRLVLVGAGDVDVPAKLRLDGALADVAPSTFAFTSEEVDELTDLMGIADDPSLTERVLDRTGGWPAAVRAHLFEVTNPDAIGSGTGTGARAVTDLVREEVLPRLRDDLAGFVLASTTCPRTDATLAQLLTGRADAAALLDECVRRGLFVDRYQDDDERPVYRWHAVLADACQAILAERDPAELERLQRTAANALRDDYPLPAIDHALRAGDPALAIDVIATSWAGILLQAGAAPLDRACRALPRPWSSSPEALYARACCLDVTGDRHGAVLLAQRAATAAAAVAPVRRERVALVAAQASLVLADEHEVLLGAVDDLTDLLASTPDLPPRTYAHLLFLAGWAEMRVRRSPEQAIKLLESARLEAIAVGDQVVAHRAGTNSAFALAYAGRFRDADARLEETNASLSARADWNAYDGDIEAVARGYVAFHRGQREEATRHLTAAADAGNGPYALVAIFHLGLLAADLGDPVRLDEAELAVRRLPDEPEHGMPWPHYATFTRCCLALARGDADLALDLARSIADLRYFPVMGGMLAEVHRQLGTVAQAEACLAAVEDLPLPSYARVGTLVTRALIAAEREETDTAHRLLEEALGLAVDEQITRPLTGPDPILRSLLGDHASRGTRHDGFLADLLARSEGGEERLRVGAQLSPREREVLGYLRSSLTTAEIAEALFVSANTVKTHQRAIYRKLGVSGRGEAIKLTI